MHDTAIKPSGAVPSVSSNLSILSLEKVNHQDGLVLLTVAIEEENLRPFVDVLDSLTAFTKYLRWKSKIAKLERLADSPARQLEAKRANQEFEKRVIDIFDDMISKGHSVKEAVSLTNESLKDSGDARSSYDTVSHVVRSKGRCRPLKAGADKQVKKR